MRFVIEFFAKSSHFPLLPSSFFCSKEGSDREAVYFLFAIEIPDALIGSLVNNTKKTSAFSAASVASGVC